MKYRRFGRTKLHVPVFSCGGMRYQHKWEDLKPEDIPAEGQANLEATIHRALELGINHFETARGYGSSEMQLGWVLSKLPRERIIVQTKVAPSQNPAEFLERFDKSLRYLQLDYVDLLAIHGINNDELCETTLRAGGCMEVARQLQREGRVRFLGFSTHAPNRIIVRAIQTGEFDYVNLHWYFVNDLNWPAVLAANEQDMGVFIISPSDKGGMLQSPPATLVDLCRPLTPMQFNDLYCLSRPQVSTLSLGASRPSDFDEHIAALDHLDYATETISPIEARIKREMERVLGTNWIENWWKGIPDYDRIPGEINVLEILRLWTFARPLNLETWARSRYNLLSKGNHWCPGNNAGDFDETKLKGALEESPFADKIPNVLREAHSTLHGEPLLRLIER